MKIPFEWQFIDNGYTTRAKVIGGWLVRYTDSDDQALSATMVFVKDPLHSWEV